MATTQMIRTEPLQARPRWTSLSGTILEGGYELQDLLEATDTQARFKVRVLGDRELESVALVFQIPDADIQGQIEVWQNVRMLRHPNLSAPFGAGRLELDGAPLAYVVLRRADEALAGVLRERPLTTEEAGEAFNSAARALEALHLNGWVHGCLSPDLVLAVGDHIQLPGECVRLADIAPAVETTVAKYLAPESAKVNLTPEADLWCLGATLFEALTQKGWTENSREELEALPEPFAAIAFRCLETSPEARCSLAEAVALYRGELKLPPRVRVAAASAIIVPQQEIAAAPKLPSEPPQEPVEVKDKQTPQTKLFVEGTAKTADIPVSETSVDSKKEVAPAVQTSTDGTGSPLSQAAAIAALAPEAAAAGAAETPGSTKIPSTTHALASNPDTYTQPKPSLVARPENENPRQRAALNEEGESKSKLLIWAGVVLFVVALLWSLWPKHKAPAAVSNLNTQTSSQTRQSSDGSAWQTRTLGPGTAASAGNTSRADNAAHSRSTAAKSAASSGTPTAMKPDAPSQTPKAASKPEGSAANRSVWRVILYTYNRLPDAEKKAKDINARHNGLHAEVFSPPGSSSPYLVTMEGRPSREEALQARRKAVGAGLPRDAYIQNYSR